MRKSTIRNIATNPVLRFLAKHLENGCLCLLILIKFIFTMSNRFNKKAVRKHPKFYRIHDYFIIGCGFLGAFLVFAGCCIIDTSLAPTFGQLMLESLPYWLSGFTLIGLILLCNNRDIWNR